MSAIAAAVFRAVKFVNLFARCQHLSDIAANVYSNILSYPVPLFPRQFRPKYGTEDGKENGTEAATGKTKT